jgi:NAD(P)-dependent dehydrogenase (short-subunit alcohol dehydrogenase family)
MPTLLITDADRGIAPEFVRQYARDGWRVIATCLAPDATDELSDIAEEYVTVEIHALDVTDRDAIYQLSVKLDNTTIDILLNNAGLVSTDRDNLFALLPQRMCGLDFPEWEKLFRINTLGPMAMVEAFADLVAASGEKKIISLSSRLASIAGNGDGAYYAYRSTEAALNAAMRSMAIDLAPSGIACAVLHPDDPEAPSFPALPAPEGQRASHNVAGLRAQIAALVPENAGRFLGPDGHEVPW